MYPDRIERDPSKRTPWIILEPGRIFIMGRSIPENASEFYRPVYDWIAAYSNNHNGKSKIDIGFEYLNTSSTKWVYTILKELSALKGIKSNTEVIWHYEQGDEDMGELGFILRSLVDCPFVVVEVNEMNPDYYKKVRKAK